MTFTSHYTETDRKQIRDFEVTEAKMNYGDVCHIITGYSGNDSIVHFPTFKEIRDVFQTNSRGMMRLFISVNSFKERNEKIERGEADPIEAIVMDELFVEKPFNIEEQKQEVCCLSKYVKSIVLSGGKSTCPVMYADSVETLMSAFPEMRKIVMPCCKRVSVRYSSIPKKLSDGVYLQVGGSFEGENQRGNFPVPIFAPGFTFDKRYQESEKYTLCWFYIVHPEMYDEESSGVYNEYVKKHIGEIVRYAAVRVHDEVFVEKALKTFKMRPSVYEDILDSLDQETYPNLYVTVMNAFKEHIDVEKLQKRRETTSINRLMNPYNAHDMKKLWQWSSYGNGVMIMKRLQSGDESEPDVLRIPEKIGKLPVLAIGSRAFDGRRSKIGKELIVPDTVRDIMPGAFAGAQYAKVTLPDNIWHFSKEMFSNSAVRSVNTPKALVSLGENCFSQSCIEKFEIPEGIEEIPSGCFNSSALKEITIPQSVRKIGSNAFAGCRNLKKMTVPKGVTQIGESAFSNCQFDELVLEGTLDVVPSYFYSQLETSDVKCEGRQIFNIPDGVKEIGERAFYYCTQYSEITIPDSVRIIGQYAFCHVHADSISTNAGYILPYAFAGAKCFTARLDKTCIIKSDTFSRCQYLKCLYAPHVKIIESSAFYDCQNLTEIHVGALAYVAEQDYSGDFMRRLEKVYIHEPCDIDEIQEIFFMHNIRCKDKRPIEFIKAW